MPELSVLKEQAASQMVDMELIRAHLHKLAYKKVKKWRGYLAAKIRRAAGSAGQPTRTRPGRIVRSLMDLETTDDILNHLIRMRGRLLNVVRAGTALNLYYTTPHLTIGENSNVVDAVKIPTLFLGVEQALSDAEIQTTPEGYHQLYVELFLHLGKLSKPSTADTTPPSA